MCRKVNLVVELFGWRNDPRNVATQTRLRVGCLSLFGWLSLRFNSFLVELNQILNSLPGNWIPNWSATHCSCRSVPTLRL